MYDNDGHRMSLTTNNSVTTTYGYDADSRLTSLSFTTPGNNSLGQLAYNYDNDSRVTSESGSLARLNLPQTEGPNYYYNANQIKTWNGITPPTPPDSASNLTSDPTSTATFTWDSRNQLSKVTNGPATSFTASYDAILRRDSQTTAFGGTTAYVHDDKGVAQSSTTNAQSNPISNYLSVPGTGEVLAFASTVGGTTNTYVPIQDGQGSAIGLVTSGNVLQTQFTYDPWGNPTTTGTASQYPYLYRGMEYDATGLYNAGGIYYSPNLGRPL
jgi:YD repeat-containing protein